MLTEVGSKYVCNILPCLRALEKEQRESKPLAKHGVMRLTESIYGKGGYNVTTDNFLGLTTRAV